MNSLASMNDRPTNLLCKENTVYFFFIFDKDFGRIFYHFSTGSSFFRPTEKEYKSEIHHTKINQLYYSDPNEMLLDCILIDNEW